MPVYDFKCLMCYHMFTENTKYDVVPMCPSCSSDRVEKQPVAAAGYKMKGNNSASHTPKGSGSWRSKK